MQVHRLLGGFLLLLFFDATAQPVISKNAGSLFKGIKSKLTVAEKNHVFEQLAIKWSVKKQQFVDNDDVDEKTPYLQVSFFPADINADGKEEVFIVLLNAALFEAAGGQVILFAKDSDGSYQKNTEIPAEDLLLLSRKHLGYPDLLLPSSTDKFMVWRWNGKIYQYFQKVGGQLLPPFVNKGLEEISASYQGSLKK